MRWRNKIVKDSIDLAWARSHVDYWASWLSDESGFDQFNLWPHITKASARIPHESAESIVTGLLDLVTDGGLDEFQNICARLLALGPIYQHPSRWGWVEDYGVASEAQAQSAISCVEIYSSLVRFGYVGLESIRPAVGMLARIGAAHPSLAADADETLMPLQDHREWFLWRQLEHKAFEVER